MRYFKRNWNENRRDLKSKSGCSVWFFETDQVGEVIRQIEVYQHGITQRCSVTKIKDEFGDLSQLPLDFEAVMNVEITNEEFEKYWELL